MLSGVDTVIVLYIYLLLVLTCGLNGPLTEDVFMNWLLHNVDKIGCSPHMLCWYVDDIFCAFDATRNGSILL